MFLIWHVASRDHVIREFEYEFVNVWRVVSAKDNNGSICWNLHIQSGKGVTAYAWKYAIKCV